MNHQIQRAGLISGIGIFIMVLTVPVAEFVIFPKLINYTDPEATFNAIKESRNLFTLGIFLHLMTLICDVVVAWSLYIFLKPADKQLSLLAAFFRITFAMVTLASLLNLISVLNLTSNSAYLAVFDASLYSEVLLTIKNFNQQWGFAFSFFSIYLILLGVLVYKATYIPKLFGILLIIAGTGYLVNTLRSFFFPSISMDYFMITYFGELVFMFWLLIKGWRVKVFAD
ncbi:MAG: DUF4386 domain-containing protein [Bacteroidota bacterium]